MLDKIYRPAVLILLVLILTAQVLGAILSSRQNAECLAAVEKTQSSLPTILQDYEKAVYKTKSTDTIYKQILLANEYQVILLETQIALDAACK